MIDFFNTSLRIVALLYSSIDAAMHQVHIINALTYTNTLTRLWYYPRAFFIWIIIIIRAVVHLIKHVSRIWMLLFFFISFNSQLHGCIQMYPEFQQKGIFFIKKKIIFQHIHTSIYPIYILLLFSYYKSLFFYL